jgi:hypothetical protein
VVVEVVVVEVEDVEVEDVKVVAMVFEVVVVETVVGAVGFVDGLVGKVLISVDEMFAKVSIVV